MPYLYFLELPNLTLMGFAQNAKLILMTIHLVILLIKIYI